MRKIDVVAAECDERVNNALTDLSAYALTLDSERAFEPVGCVRGAMSERVTG